MAYKTTNPLSGNSEGLSQIKNKSFINTNPMDIQETTDFDFNGFEQEVIKPVEPNENYNMSYFINMRDTVIRERTTVTLKDIVSIIKDETSTLARSTETFRHIARYLKYKDTKNIDTNNYLDKYFSRKGKDFTDLEVLDTEYNAFKHSLPGINPNTFVEKRNNDNVQNIPCIAVYDLDVFADLDAREEKFIEITQSVFKNHVVLCYRTGKGLRLFIRIRADKDNYKVVYEDCGNILITDIFNLQYDKAAIHIGLFAGIFHDPNVFVNYDTHAYVCTDKSVYKEGFKKYNSYTDFEQVAVDVSTNVIETFIRTEINKGWKDGRNACSFSIGSQCNQFGFDSNVATAIFNQILATELDVDSQEYREFSGAFERPYRTYQKAFAQNRKYAKKGNVETTSIEKAESVQSVSKKRVEKKSNVHTIQKNTAEKKDAIYNFIDTTDKGLLISPTGSGKTWLIINNCLDKVKTMSYNTFICITAPTIVLTNQIADDTIKLAKERGETPTIIRAVGKKESGGDYWFKTFSKINNQNSREPFIFVGTPEQLKVLYNRYMEVAKEDGRLELECLFIDEIHTIAKHTEFREEGLSALSKLIDSSKKVIAMSATPSESLKQIFPNTFEITFDEGVTNRQRFDVSYRTMFNDETIRLDVEESIKNGRKAIVYIEHKDTLSILKKKFEDNNLTCTMITGDNKIDDVAKAFLSSKQITTDILLCTSIIQDGFSIENCGQVDIFMQYSNRFGCGYEHAGLRQVSARIRDNKEITKVRFYAENRVPNVDNKFLGWEEKSYYQYFENVAKEFSEKATKEVKGKTKKLKTCTIDAQSLLNADGSINRLLVANKARSEYIRGLQYYQFLINVMNVMELGVGELKEISDDRYNSDIDKEVKEIKLKLREEKDFNTDVILSIIEKHKDGVVEALYQKASKSKKLTSSVYGKDLGIALDLETISIELDKKSYSITEELFKKSNVKVILERAEYVRNVLNPETKHLFTEEEMSEVLAKNYSAVKWGAWQRENSNLLMLMGCKPSNKAKVVDRETDLKKVSIIEAAAKLAEIGGKKLLMSDLLFALSSDYTDIGIDYKGEDLTPEAVGKLLKTFFVCEAKKTTDKSRKQIRYWEIYGRKTVEGVIVEEQLTDEELSLHRLQEALKRLMNKNILHSI